MSARLPWHGELALRRQARNDDITSRRFVCEWAGHYRKLHRRERAKRALTRFVLLLALATLFGLALFGGLLARPAL